MSECDEAAEDITKPTIIDETLGKGGVRNRDSGLNSRNPVSKLPPPPRTHPPTHGNDNLTFPQGIRRFTVPKVSETSGNKFRKPPTGSGPEVSETLGELGASGGARAPARPSTPPWCQRPWGTSLHAFTNPLFVCCLKLSAKGEPRYLDLPQWRASTHRQQRSYIADLNLPQGVRDLGGPGRAGSGKHVVREI